MQIRFHVYVLRHNEPEKKKTWRNEEKFNSIKISRKSIVFFVFFWKMNFDEKIALYTQALKLIQFDQYKKKERGREKMGAVWISCPCKFAVQVLGSGSKLPVMKL